MKSSLSLIVLLSLLCYAFSYRIIDIQSDDPGADDNKPDKFDAKSYQNQKDQSWINLISEKMSELEASNKNLKNELIKTQHDLDLQKQVQINRQTTANIKLITKDEDRNEEDNFWSWICKISKSLVKGFLNFFHIEM